MMEFRSSTSSFISDITFIPPVISLLNSSAFNLLSFISICSILLNDTFLFFLFFHYFIFNEVIKYFLGDQALSKNS